MRRVLLLLLLLFVLVAPAVEAKPVPCPAHTVLDEGTPMKIVTARALRFSQPAGAYVLTLSTRDIPCSEILAEARPQKRDEVSIAIGFGPVANAQQYVFFRNESKQVATELVTAPSRTGDRIELCVRERVKLTASMPMSNDAARSIEVHGLIRATFCGTTKH
jgi:hypothetical protein